MSVVIEEVYINIIDFQINVSLFVFHIIPFLFGDVPYKEQYSNDVFPFTRDIWKLSLKIMISDS